MRHVRWLRFYMASAASFAPSEQGRRTSRRTHSRSRPLEYGMPLQRSAPSVPDLCLAAFRAAVSCSDDVSSPRLASPLTVLLSTQGAASHRGAQKGRVV